MVTLLKFKALRAFLLFLLVVVLTLVAPTSMVQAKDYSFTVDRNIVDVHIKKDGSIDIEYWITFTVGPGAPPIDVIDVGMPNEHYDSSSITADMDGVPITDIRKSPALEYGVRAYLGSHAIPAGSTGTFHLVANNPHMIYPDTEDETYASMEFSPTWYGSRYTHGITYLQVTIYFPPGVGSDETRYHREKFTEAKMEGDTPVMTWINPSAKPDKQYMFGVSFPKKYVNKVFPAPGEGGGGFPAGLVWFLLIGVVIGGGIALVKARNHRKKMRYLPPKIKVEGVQVKKGLTAVEAAVVAETPLNKVLSMILFGLVRKRIVTVQFTKPLKLEVLKKNWRRGDESEDLMKAIYAPGLPFDEFAEEGEEGVSWVKARDYELGFLSAIDRFGSLSEDKLKDMLIRLIRSVQRKMKGYAARPTAAYYQEIVDKAWQQVSEVETPEVIDENLEWAMLDRDFEKKMTKTMEGRPVLVPVWYWAYGGHYGGGVPAGAAQAVPGGSFTLPGSEFAHNIVSGFESAADNIIGDVTSFRGGVTAVTNPPPPPRSGGGEWFGGGGGSGGCACACACAGCACACAGGGA